MKFCFKFSTEGLQNLLAHRCRRLKYLDLSGIHAVNDVLVTELCQSQQRLLGAPYDGSHHEPVSHSLLEHLEIAMCSQVTDVAVQQLISACTSLRTLNISRCCKISDAARTYAGHIIVQ